MNVHRMLPGCAALLIALSVSGARADQAAFSTTARAIPNLLGHWSFEGDYNSHDGKNNAAANGDLSKIKFCPGVKGGQGVEFSNPEQNTGEGNYLRAKAPIGGAFDSPNLSVFIWAKVSSPAEDGRWDNLIDRTSLWYIETRWREVDGKLGISSINRIYTPAGTQDGGTDQIRSHEATPPVLLGGNEWHLYGFTYDGKVMVNYVDGKEFARKEYTEGVGPTAQTPVVEDSKHGNYDLNWAVFNGLEDDGNGCLDDTVIYGRALTPAEVKSLFDSMMQ
jgi:Concanavalin A-like lectin/glucanases superfamily